MLTIRHSAPALAGLFVIALSALTLSGGALAAVNYNSSKSNTGNLTARPAACPAGARAVVVPGSGKTKCVRHAKTYNASHSNTASEGPCPTCAKCVNPKGCS